MIKIKEWGIMTIKECYERLGGNYEEVFGRFRRDAMIKKFAVKFLTDKSFESLSGALNAGEVQQAFEAAHTLKGVCANLSFTRLAESASKITEMLRGKNLEEACQFFATVEEDYKVTVAVLEEFAAE